MKQKFYLADMLILGILGIFAIVSIFPFYETVILSFAKVSDIGTQKVFLYPISFDLSAYKYLIFQGSAVRGLIVSIFVTIAGTALNMIVTTAGAYALSKKTMPGRSLIFNGIIFTMFFTGGLVPFFLTIKALHLQNNILVMIIPAAVSTFYLIIMKNFFNKISPSLEESAKMDGANDITILFRIIIPVSLPVIAAITLFYAVDRWNEWWFAMIFINNTKLYPLQLVLRNIIINISSIITNTSGMQDSLGVKKVFPESVKAAIIVISAVPILMVYPSLQKYFASGIMIGSIKG
jgi:putative aldouronate transport system permease protein